jgi:hypothetical protein
MAPALRLGEQDNDGTREEYRLDHHHPHTGSPWYREAIFYAVDVARFTDDKPVFSPAQETTWSWDGVRQAWYLHHVPDVDPDLNTDHPEPRAETRSTVELRPHGYAWWEQRGVPQLSLANGDDA